MINYGEASCIKMCLQKDRLQGIHLSQKNYGNRTHKKDEEITTEFYSFIKEDVANKAYLETK